MDDLYNPEITDLEANEYHGNPRPVVYLDEAKALCDKQSIGARKEELEEIWQAFENSGIDASNRTFNFERRIKHRLSELETALKEDK